MARTAARDECDLALPGGDGAGDENRILVELDDIGMGGGETPQAFVQDLVDRVHELLHGVSPVIGFLLTTKLN